MIVADDIRRNGAAVIGDDLGGMRPGDGYTRFKETMRPVPFILVGEWMSVW